MICSTEFTIGSQDVGHARLRVHVQDPGAQVHGGTSGEAGRGGVLTYAPRCHVQQTTHTAVAEDTGTRPELQEK